MPQNDEIETILIVDDEEPVRKTFREWLEGADFPCRILAAADAEKALVEANRNPIDLAILDWNLGAGNDGLRLLEDLYVFNPDIVAIMITGFAHQATPLDAMRMGIRDYLDKNQDLDRTTFLHAVRRQLERIRPAKRERRLHQSLAAFREAVEKVLPLVQSAAALNDPVPFPEAARSLLRFVQKTTGAADGVLLLHSYDPDRQPAELLRAYDLGGTPLDQSLVPFSRSLAATVVSLQEPYVINDLDNTGTAGSVELQPFEHGRHSLLATPMAIAPGIQAVLELFDKRTPEQGFTRQDQRCAAAAAEFGTEMLRQALAEKQIHQVLFDAIEAAVGASDSVTETFRESSGRQKEASPPSEVIDRLKEGLSAHVGSTADAGESVKLAEAIRRLSVRHGPKALVHCAALIDQVRELLDAATGAGETAS
jgi:ActR/RegA family two-component response regulator